MNRRQRRRERHNGRPVRLLFPPLSPLRRLANAGMSYLMPLALGNFYERPQETHAWNYLKLNPGEHFWLEWAHKVTVQGDQAARRVRYGLHHLTWLGGWKKFVVLAPHPEDVALGEEWYVGWLAGSVCGVSMIPIEGVVRMLIGPDKVQFFALNARHKPVRLMILDFGRLGHAGYWHRSSLR